MKSISTVNPQAENGHINIATTDNLSQGWIKLYRSCLENGWIKNHKLWAFWSYCLLKASHKEHNAIVGLEIVHLLPGQFIFGRKKAAQETSLTEQEIRTIIEFLKKAENLTIKTTNKYSIVTIVNWDTYQGNGTDEQPSNQPTTNQQLTTYKNVKNVKNIKKTTIGHLFPTGDCEDTHGILTNETETETKQKVSESVKNNFNIFWKAYPRKKSKGDAEKVWNKIKPNQKLFDIILSKIDEAKNSNDWLKENGQFIPYPAKWLSRKGWEDEYVPVKNVQRLLIQLDPIEKCRQAMIERGEL